MRTLAALSLVALPLFTGCASTKDAPMPDPGSPLSHLSVLIGDWTGEARAVELPAMMQAMMPAEGPNSFAGESTGSWVLGGTFLQQKGWQEMGPDTVVQFVEYIKWDEEAGKYHAWYFNESGDVGENWMTRDEEGVFHMEATGTRFGVPYEGGGTWRMIDADTMVWTWTEPMGEETFRMEGANRRR